MVAAISVAVANRAALANDELCLMPDVTRACVKEEGNPLASIKKPQEVPAVTISVNTSVIAALPSCFNVIKQFEHYLHGTVVDGIPPKLLKEIVEQISTPLANFLICHKKKE